MSWHSIKRDPADIAFSQYIRLKGKKCTRCGKQGYGDRGIDGLEASHFRGRAKWTTRFDEENVDVLCTSCHMYFTNNKNEYREWKKEKLGEKRYDLLELRANQTGSRDFKMARLVWRQALKDLENE